ncbi:MAG: YggT family protein [Syntrophomonadaceae bacterium]|nr:YggT family protein [Syntrophomonadaceae bacterium]
MVAANIILFVNLAFQLLIYLVIGRCILSFIKHNPYQPVIKFIYDITEPIMAPFKKLIPAAGGVDFSPILVVLALSLAQKLINDLLLMFL